MAEITIGILALQGAFAEHETHLTSLAVERRIVILLVRTVEDLYRCDGLIIPGGESTTIALLARLSGLLEPLRDFIESKPVWGTCAGAILLSQAAEGTKKGGQELFGGLTVKTARNGWGSQVESFEAELTVHGLRDSARPYPGIFIRAPVLLSLDASPQDPPIQIIARLPAHLLPPSKTHVPPDAAQAVVGLRQGNHLLTTFHPELTQDDRFHEYFVKECVLPTLED